MARVTQLFYVSSATRPYDSEAIQAILRTSRRNNKRHDVTGCLLYAGNCFAQVLEGSAQSVQSLAARIASDPRHHGVHFLLEAVKPEREYVAWSMGYLHDATLERDLLALIADPAQPPEVVISLMDRMRPDPTMGGLDDT